MRQLLLAHLSQSIPVEPVSVCMSVCVCVCVCVFTFSNMNISETSGPIATKFYLKHHGVGGKGCIRFWTRSDQNSGVHGN